MRPCIVGLGSNQGDSPAIFAAAAARLAASPGVELHAASSLYASAPAGGPPDQHDFLNAALLLDTDWPAEMLLDRLLDIESEFGRERTIRWGPRPLDLDLLLAGAEVIQTPRLTVPHPRLMVRRFAVVPAAEIAQWMRVPTLSCSLKQLQDHLARTPRSVWLMGESETFREEWRGALQSQLPEWSFPRELPDEAQAELGLFPPRFLAIAAPSAFSDALLSFPMPIPRVVVEGSSPAAATAEVVAHCIASDTILESRAGPEWLPR